MRNYESSGFISAMLHTDAVHIHTETKVCSVCKNPKDKDEFSKNARAADGRRNECKDCSRIVANERNSKKRSENNLLKSMMPI